MLQEPLTAPDTTPTSGRSEQSLVADFERYEQAQRAVDQLSDAGFDLSRTSIVWRGLRRTEQVIGRRTVATAALRGAMSGTWFGGLLGVLLLAFVQLEDGVSAWSVVLSYALVGLVVGAVWMAIGHWAQRGRRDFEAYAVLDAERYEVWVGTDQTQEARTVLGAVATG